MAGNRKAAIDELEKTLQRFIRNKKSVALLINRLNELSEREMEDIVSRIEAGTFTLPLEMANLDEFGDADMDEAYAFAEGVGLEPEQRLRIPDPETGDINISPLKYLVVPQQVRRPIQYLKKKVSYADNDKTIDHFTGMPTGASKSSSISFPELNNMVSRPGSYASALELFKVRGGDAVARAHMERQIEETGSASLEPIMALDTRPKIVESLHILLTCAHLRNTM